MPDNSKWHRPPLDPIQHLVKLANLIVDLLFVPADCVRKIRLYRPHLVQQHRWQRQPTQRIADSAIAFFDALKVESRTALVRWA
jgi:hypothetical protein